MPQNLLRNVARSSCQTRFTLLVDADMIPKAGLHRDLEDFLRADQLAVSCPLCAFVVPVYEISEKLGEESGKPLPLPGDKATLLRLVGEGKARQFHTVSWILPFYELVLYLGTTRRNGTLTGKDLEPILLADKLYGTIFSCYEEQGHFWATATVLYCTVNV